MVTYSNCKCGEYDEGCLNCERQRIKKEIERRTVDWINLNKITASGLTSIRAVINDLSEVLVFLENQK